MRKIGIISTLGHGFDMPNVYIKSHPEQFRHGCVDILISLVPCYNFSINALHRIAKRHLHSTKYMTHD